MIITDYFRSIPDATWEYGKQLGVQHGTIRLPETTEFDLTNVRHWEDVHKRFTDAGIKPIIIEPMPNNIHDHIKIGDEKRDESIEKALAMFPIMDRLDIRTICFNFMAHVGWTRTSSRILERGGAFVTGFDIQNYEPVEQQISAEQLWKNYEYFIRAAVPQAEKYGIKLALHPDDPPLEKLGNVSRILISADNMEKAVTGFMQSESLGYAFCQATYEMMGEDLYKVIPRFADKIMFIHFRNVVGNKHNFRETFHDNGVINMPKIMQLYKKLGINVPIRVDHVPTMYGEELTNAGYDVLGRLYAIGYLKGIIETLDI